MSDPKPRWALRFLKWFCPGHLYEEIAGDLTQQYRKEVKRYGEQKAKQRLVWNVLRFFRLEIILRNKFSPELIRTYMIRNYLKIAFRNFNRQRSYTLLNVIGLSLGMAAALKAAMTKPAETLKYE